MPFPTLVLAVALAVSLSAAPVASQVRWREVGDVTPRSDHAMAWDHGRGRAVLYGLDWNTVWEWDGSRWERRPCSPSPPIVLGAAMTYDPVRRVVLWVGAPPFGAAQTWEWNGSTWSQRVYPTAVSGRRRHGLVWDRARGRAVLFGGLTNADQVVADTWEWDGVNWLRRAPTASPTARKGHGMAYDSARRRVVLFGGEGRQFHRFLDDTWEYDGTTWTRAMPSTVPPLRGYQGMCFDETRQRTVMFGGHLGWSTANYTEETWEWDGNDWVLRNPAHRPPARRQMAMVYDRARGRTLLMGGEVRIGTTADAGTWTYDGSDWTLSHDPVRPTCHPGVAASYDLARERVVLFDGAPTGANTWEWDGRQWVDRTPMAHPPRVQGAAMVYDPVRARSVLFGGAEATRIPINETWRWDGVGWGRIGVGLLPPPRELHAMVYDVQRDRMVLFGGSDGAAWLGDTWEFDGVRWSRRTPTVSPTPRSGHAMAYDVSRGRTVLFGGEDGAGNRLADTWEWDGVAWRSVASAVVPPSRTGHSMVFDLASRRVVMFGDPIRQRLSTWEWDGVEWRERVPILVPVALSQLHQAMAYDAAREQTVLIGARVPHPGESVTWVYENLAQAHLIPFGAGCSGAGPAPLLRGALLQRPWIGDPFSVEIVQLPSNAVSTMVVGLSRDRLGTAPLPLDLGFLGMPGCRLHVSIDDMTSPVTGSTAGWTWQIADSRSLVGIPFHLQGLVLDPGASGPAEAAVTGALRGVIGAR